jgi:hypothetical protein
MALTSLKHVVTNCASYYPPPKGVGAIIGLLLQVDLG